MILKKLYINQFRNYEQSELSFSENVNVLYGENGSGKTNILEAIYMLGRGISFRSNYEKELINDDLDYNTKEKGYYIKAIFKSEHNAYDTTIELSYKLTAKKYIKHVFINKKEIKTRRDLIGKLLFVLFLPTDTELIEGEPSIRRQFFHLLTSMVDGSYLETLIKYNKILKMRNKMLSMKSNDFHIYDDELASLGMIIKQNNIEYAKLLETTMNEIYSNIFGESVNESANEDINENAAENNDESNTEKSNDKNENNHQKNAYSIRLKNCLTDIHSVEEYVQKLRDTVEEQKRLSTTYFGIHRADYDLYFNGKLAKKYASQGQKRIYSLIMKLAEDTIISQARKENAILLIDDALLELDEYKRNKVLEYIEKKGQVFITVTEEDKVQIQNTAYNIKEYHNNN